VGGRSRCPSAPRPRHDSDIDLLVVLPRLDYSRRHELMVEMMLAVDPGVPVEVFPTDERECLRRRDVVGSRHYWPLREGKVVYAIGPQDLRGPRDCSAAG
jgi:predicted nucleotidyltransferase